MARLPHARGGTPGEGVAFIDDLTDKEAAAVVAGMKEIAERGLAAAKHLRGDLYEVRADASTRSFRVLFPTEGRYSPLSLFRRYEKRTQKTPPRELDLAEGRLREAGGDVKLSTLHRYFAAIGEKFAVAV